MTSDLIITQVINNVNRADLTRPQVLQWMNNRKDMICNYDDFSFMENTDLAFTIAGQKDYTLPLDYKSELHCFLSDATGVTKFFLDKWVGTEAENAFSNETVQAKPYAYWIWQDAYFFYPIPDDIYTINLKYYRYLPDFTDIAQEENELGKRWVDLIVDGATSDAYHFFMQADKQAEWEGKWNIEFQRLIRRQAQRKTKNYTPRVRLRTR